MHAMNVMRARLTAACLRVSHACRDEALDRAEARMFNIMVATLFGGDCAMTFHLTFGRMSAAQDSQESESMRARAGRVSPVPVRWPG